MSHSSVKTSSVCDEFVVLSKVVFAAETHNIDLKINMTEKNFLRRRVCFLAMPASTVIKSACSANRNLLSLSLAMHADLLVESLAIAR
jgi:hypothetical protein